MKRSRRFLITFLCFTLLGICILPALSIHAINMQDSLADAIDEANALSPSMSDMSYGLDLKNILDDERLVTHYGNKQADLSLLNTVRGEIDPYVSEIGGLIRNTTPGQNTLQRKTDLLGLTLKGLYTGTLAWIYHSNIDDSIKNVPLTVSIEFGSNYQITSTEMTVSAYYSYLRDDVIGGKSNDYFTKAQPDSVYRYFTWMFRAIFEAKISLLSPDDSLPAAQKENIRHILDQALVDVRNCSYMPGVPEETFDGIMLSEGEDGYNFRQIYQKASLAVEFSDLYSLLCPEQDFSQSTATKDLISSLSSAKHNSEINEILETALDRILKELQGTDTTNNTYSFAYFSSLRKQIAQVFDTANATNTLVNADHIRNIFAEYEFSLAKTSGKDEISETLDTLLKNTKRYPKDSEEKATLEALAHTAISALDACTDNHGISLETARGKTEMALFDEYLDAVAQSEMPYLSQEEIALIKDELSTLHDSAASATRQAEDLLTMEAVLTESRAEINTLLCQAAKSNLTKKTAAIHAAIERYEYLDRESKEEFFSLLEAAKAEALTALSSARDSVSALSIQKEASKKLDQIDKDAAKREYQKALEHVKNKKDEYSDEQYGKITDILDRADSELGGVPSREDYLNMKDQVLGSVNQLPNRLDEVFHELSSNKESYSAENWSRLENIYNQTKNGLIDLPEGTTAIELIQVGISQMQKVRTKIIYTPDKQLATEHPADYQEGDPYYGAIFSPNGLPSDSQLFIGRVGKDSGDSVAKRIMQAAKNGRITDRNGNPIPKDLNRLLKDCYVSIGFDVSFTPTEDETTYSLSVLLPKGTSLAHAIGVVFLAEDGSAEYYEMTNDGLKISFDPNRFSAYYVVNSNVVNLLPIILILTAILIAEVVILAIMYARRSRRKKAPLSFSAMALVPPYFPENGWMTIILLSIAILLLGGWIASIPILEKMAVKKANRPVPEPMPEKEEGPAKESTAPPCELPEAEPTLSLPEAENMPALPEAETVPSLPEAEAIPILPRAEPIPVLPPASEPVFIDLEEYTGNRRGEINLDTLAANFEEGDRITLNDMKRKKLISKQVGAVKVLGRGQLEKTLIVIAQDFSTEAREKIERDGGYAIVTHASPKCAQRNF